MQKKGKRRRREKKRERWRKKKIEKDRENDSGHDARQKARKKGKEKMKKKNKDRRVKNNIMLKVEKETRGSLKKTDRTSVGPPCFVTSSTPELNKSISPAHSNTTRRHRHAHTLYT